MHDEGNNGKLQFAIRQVPHFVVLWSQTDRDVEQSEFAERLHDARTALVGAWKQTLAEKLKCGRLEYATPDALAVLIDAMKSLRSVYAEAGLSEEAIEQRMETNVALLRNATAFLDRDHAVSADGRSTTVEQGKPNQTLTR